MVNKRKVRLMTRVAIYEKHESGRDLPKAKYYKSDYVGLHMWTTAVAVTISYLLILALVIACNFEFLVNNITEINYTALVIILAMVYVGMMTVFMLIAYFVYSYRYVEAEGAIKSYQGRLHKIFLMNKADRKNRGGLK